MAVKDLIGLFESPPSTGAKTVTPTHRPRSDHDGPPPSPARFITVPPKKGGMSHLISPTPQLAIPLLTTSTTSGTTNTNDEALEPSTDAADGRSKRYDDLMTVSTPTITPTTNPKLYLSDKDNKYLKDADQYQDLLPKVTYDYPPSTPTLPSDNTSFSSTPTLVTTHKHRLANHVPIPATTIFARNSAPLYLPKLDKYLSHLERPHFTTPEGTGKTQMFAPMDRLAASGSTIEQLEANSPLPSFNRNDIFGAITTAFVGLTGSSVLAAYYSLQGLFNTLQLFALILSTIVPLHPSKLRSNWREFFLGTIPNVLAFNFTFTLTESLVFLAVFVVIAAILLFFFYRSTANYEHRVSVEGFQQPEPKGQNWGLLMVTFLLTVIYLPLSTLSVHVLIWSQDLWVVPNPYINATTYPPVLPALGPPNEYRAPLDFCWTTTMEKNRVNLAPVVMIMAIVALAALTIWFPLRLHQVIQQSMPRVDPYTELGQRRSKSEMDREYERLLIRDRNPFSFLYKGYRRNWGTYESTFLLAKLSALLIIAVIDSNNCLFRSFSSSRMAVVRQTILLVSTIAFFCVQWFLGPFIDPVGNASEWVSRLNYVAAATVALAVALNAPGTSIIDGPLLYAIYGITYGFSIYFLIIDTSRMQRVVKRLARRIDFSIDVFSPRLDLSYTSLHIRRRIWQESITTILLTDSGCSIPKKQRMNYAQARDGEYPPYLLDFTGSPGERHVENLKILREIGSASYRKAVMLVYGSDNARFKAVEEEIQRHFVGPDCYWKDSKAPPKPGKTKGFGNAWWIPFPPTLVVQYDDGPFAVLQDMSEFELYVSQNSSPVVRRKRQVRMSLRALDGQTVMWPYEHIQSIGSNTLCCGKRGYTANSTAHYGFGVLRIKHRGHLIWQGLQLGSGFDVEIVYGTGVTVDGTVIGLTDDYDLTPQLSRFLMINEERVLRQLGNIEATLANYRQDYRKESRKKANALTYKFLSNVYDVPKVPKYITESFIECESDFRVRRLMDGSQAALLAAYERFSAVSVSEATRWWYIFWDDMWRRNHETISGLQLHATDFNPYYPTSIAYTPLPRPALESFLIGRGLLSKKSQGTFFHTGFLNKIYLRLNDTVFGGSSQGIMFHIGDDGSELDMESVDIRTRAGSSTMGTGGGTDYDYSLIQARPTYKWEALLSDPLRRGKNGRRRWFAKMGAWLGITPLWGSETLSQGLAVDVRLENGRYVLLDPS